MTPEAASVYEVLLLADTLMELMSRRGIRVMESMDCMEMASDLLTAYERKIK